ncbi:CBS domain-containing protein [Ochrobactrum daejeonense]|uniref:CBS domain-containing protein n=1 Tax=Brucella daejeonensis TaxID=659015 RepID=A0A7W9EKF3_9HYPH|nr:CBS domain-containing protein [Brucella daejeonensis]MBB5701233.1 CBS domain-containing protein [Brucella daejeonensis]NKB79756.1 CBS domain-containing protein [Brucella daejeonensis]
MFADNIHALTSARLAVIDIDEDIQAAALVLSRPGIGLVVVCSTDGCMQGVLSKSNIVRHTARSASTAFPASQLMIRPIVKCRPQDDLHDVWKIMCERGLQNMPVVDERDVPTGIVNIRDTLKSLLEQEEMQEQMLFNYVAGIGYR